MQISNRFMASYYLQSMKLHTIIAILIEGIALCKVIWITILFLSTLSVSTLATLNEILVCHDVIIFFFDMLHSNYELKCHDEKSAIRDKQAHYSLIIPELRSRLSYFYHSSFIPISPLSIHQRDPVGEFLYHF